MKLYLLEQKIYHEGEFGELIYAGLMTIGVYTSKEVPSKMLADYVPVKFYTQYKTGLQELILTEIDSDVQLNEISTNDNLAYLYEENVPEYNEQ